MFSFLRAADPQRTKFSHVTTLKTENGRSSVSFYNDPDLSSDKASVSFTLPPCEPGPNPKDNSIMIPPFHTHPNQEETFLVTAGTGLFHLNQKRIAVTTGNEITIPQGEYHKFTNASTTESMTTEAWYDPANLRREERFFRNLCGYLSDLTAKGGIGMLESASTAQLALFAWEADIMICEPSKHFWQHKCLLSF
jgi:mannose-6-phosphate isomerase-like protein (cupin superfamily)